MKNPILYFLFSMFVFMNLQAQELPTPKIIAPEDTFYDYLDNTAASNPEIIQGNVKKVIKSFKKYEEGNAKTVERENLFFNKSRQLEKTIRQIFSFGIENSREVTNHLESPKVSFNKNGNRIMKIIEKTPPDNAYEYDPDFDGNETYVYENDLLIAYFNNNDSISYLYDNQNRLIQEKQFISIVAEEYSEDGDITYWRSDFEDSALVKINYKNNRVQNKIFYNKFGELIEIYKTTFTYGKAAQLENFETVYKRYLFDFYEHDIPIDKQQYDTFQKVSTMDSIQTGKFTFSNSNKIRSYEMDTGERKESYTLTYDKNDRLHWVEGVVHFVYVEKPQKQKIAYEYLYDELGNPKVIKVYSYKNGEKILQKETVFEIEYYE